MTKKGIYLTIIIIHISRAYKADIVTKVEWVTANKCRKCLRVLTIADISSGNGQHTDANMWNFKRHYDRTRPIYWARQGKPADLCRKITKVAAGAKSVIHTRKLTYAEILKRGKNKR